MSLTHKSIDLHVNVEPLKRALEAHKDEFGKYPYRGLGNSPHREMTDIWVRYNDIQHYLDGDDPSKLNSESDFNAEHDSVWYPVPESILNSVKDISFKIMAKVDGERLGGILITKLPPRGSIYPHIDGGWHAAYYDKYYVPVKNKPGAIFGFPDGEIKPKEGDVYWFKNSVYHWVVNNTDEDRIAMIICIKTDNRLGG